ncbi:S-layer homology domain-containing protein [Paenibacillus sp. N3.4]|uniref:S-layer homology domain-containing protein n=1 Tax=Paenibacillus sp. N3.4 TaxID=2603222 RepID=UPI0021C2C436|nr:YcdB/YcdC domain-containing protein [Paenibacillus sp. N3.4]
MKRTLHTLSKSMFITVLGVSVLASSALAAEMGTTTAQHVVSVTESAASTNSISSNLNPADAKISKDLAVERTKKLFPALKEATVQSVDFGDPNTYPPRNEKVWTIQWEFKTENGSSGFSSRVDAMNGDLLQMYVPSLNDPRSITHFPPKVSREEAQKLAKDFILQAAPSITSYSLQMNDDDTQFKGQTSLFGPVQYNFNYNIQINGVKLNNGGVQVTVDGEGNVIQFYKAPQYSSYPSTEPKITLEQATTFAKKHQEAELQYIPIRKGGGKVQSWWLGYVPSLHPIDAQTGQFVTQGMSSSNQGPIYVAVPKKDKVFTPITADGELTAEQAAQIVEQAFPLLKDKKLQQKSLNDGWSADNHKVWSINWGNEELRMGMGPFGSSNRATVDAQTGIIVQYSTDIFGPYPPAAKPVSNEPVISKEAALQKAEELINLIYPNASEVLKRMETNNSEDDSSNPLQNYSFSFQRFYKGLLVNGDNVNITLDLQGNVTNYYGNRTTLDDQVMGALKLNLSKEQALSQIWESTKLELELNSLGGYTINNTYEQPIAKLVYNQIFKTGSLNFKALDATDGTWKLLWSDQTTTPQTSVKPTDITDHWAQKDLETMVQYQVLTTDDSGKLNPNQTIKYGDWLTMMATALTPQYKNYYNGNRNDKPLFADITETSPYFDAVRTFVQQKWLEAEVNGHLNADQELTRETLASSLVHIVKYNKLASLFAPTAKDLPFTDSDLIKNKSDVALAVKLGLMEGSDGAFNPSAKVTKAEAAVIIMRLVHLQGKLDQTIGQ